MKSLRVNFSVWLAALSAIVLAALVAPAMAVTTLDTVNVRGYISRGPLDRDIMWSDLQDMFRGMYVNRTRMDVFTQEPDYAANEMDVRCNQNSRNVIGGLITSTAAGSTQRNAATRLLGMLQGPGQYGGLGGRALEAWFSGLPSVPVSNGQRQRVMTIVWADGSSTSFRLNGTTGAGATVSPIDPYPEDKKDPPSGEGTGCPNPTA